MSSIILENLVIDFPVVNSHRRNGSGSLSATVGGFLRRTTANASDTVVRALDNVSIDLRSGDRIALLGHNGAGKTTLLKVMAGIYPPSSGLVRIDGRISTLFRNSAVVEQEETGYQNILLMCVCMGLSIKEAKGMAQEIIDFSELGPYAHLPVRTYSAGMRTRLQFGVATAIRPQILLLDEGLGTGDAHFTKKAEERLQGMMDEIEILVLASHSQSLLASFCNKAVLMEHGMFVQTGDFQDVYKSYEATI